MKTDQQLVIWLCFSERNANFVQANFVQSHSLLHDWYWRSKCHFDYKSSTLYRQSNMKSKKGLVWLQVRGRLIYACLSNLDFVTLGCRRQSTTNTHTSTAVDTDVLVEQFIRDIYWKHPHQEILHFPCIIWFHIL